MKEKFIIYLFIILILSACESKNETMPTTTLNTPPTTEAYTSTISPTETSQRFLKTPTLSPTLLPTITPTFNVASIITRTSEPPEKCPKSSNTLLPDLSMAANDFGFNTDKVLGYLNAGGNPSDLISIVRQAWTRNEIFTKNEVIRDLTGDGISEILVIPSELHIFGCKDGQYKTLFTHFSEYAGMNGIEQQLVGIQDMNLDAIPEIIIADFGCGGMGAGRCLDVYIYEWNGTKFVSLTPTQDGYEVGVSLTGGRSNFDIPTVQIRDISNNGTKELILTGGIPGYSYDDYYHYYPWRDQSDIYTWNGQYFVLLKTEFSAPVYRYQAVQDGDRAMLNGEYDKALAFYQASIFSDKLLGWSPAHKDHFKSLIQYIFDPAFQLTPIPRIPPDDPQEYPNLAAYARFRIMLLHIIQGHLKDAQVVYETLQEKFPEGSSGHEFSLIAKAFWDEYQISQHIEEACSSAISVANEYQDVLHFLGSDYHNSWQDTMYKPTDMCPFK